MSASKIAYLELPATNTAEMKTFYGSLFGWSFQDWGPDYAAFSEAGLDGGFNAGDDHREDAEIRVLLTEERVTVEKRARVREEVEVGKRTVKDQQQATEEVRREELRVHKDPNVKVQGELETGTAKPPNKKNTL